MVQFNSLFFDSFIFSIIFKIDLYKSLKDVTSIVINKISKENLISRKLYLTLKKRMIKKKSKLLKMIH